MASQNPNILYITSFFPHGPSCGAQVRVLNIGRQLKRVGKVSLAIVPLTELNQGSLDRTRGEFEVRLIARSRPAPPRSYWDRMRYELDPSFLNTRFSAVSECDREIMLRMIHEYDIIWVHSIRTANEFQIYRWPHTVLDVDDIQSRLYISYAKADSGIIRSLLDYRLSLIWWRRERLFKDRFDVLTVCSENDRRYLGAGQQVQVVPNGFALPSQVPFRSPSVPPRIGFIGTLKWDPNRDGIEWFIRRVWPQIKTEIPTVHLRLVGKGTDEYLPELGPDIKGLGWMLDPSSEIASWSAMIVPVHIGAGTRMKIAEAFGRKCPIVSTSLGAFGYEVINGEDLLLADSPQDFASACVLLVNNRELGSKLSENVWKKFLKNWTWDSIGTSVSKAVSDCLSRSNYGQHFSIS